MEGTRTVKTYLKMKLISGVSSFNNVEQGKTLNLKERTTKVTNAFSLFFIT